MTLGSCLSRTVQPTRFALVCVRVFSVYQVHGQVWSSCQTERLGVLGAGDARTSVDCDAVLILLPRSASRLARGWSRGRGRGPGPWARRPLRSSLKSNNNHNKSYVANREI